MTLIILIYHYHKQTYPLRIEQQHRKLLEQTMFLWVPHAHHFNFLTLSNSKVEILHSWIFARSLDGFLQDTLERLLDSDQMMR